MRLTKLQIQEADDLKTEEVEVPEWGGSVLVRSLSVQEGTALSERMQDENGKIINELATLYSLIYGVADPVFSEEDAAWLKQKSLGAVTKVTNVFMRLNGFDKQAVNEARKNSSETDA